MPDSLTCREPADAKLAENTVPNRLKTPPPRPRSALILVPTSVKSHRLCDFSVSQCGDIAQVTALALLRRELAVLLLETIGGCGGRFGALRHSRAALANAWAGPLCGGRLGPWVGC